MAAFVRRVGATSVKVPVFINDATVSTGAGLANVVASSVSYSILRDDQATISSGTCSSGGTLGTYSVSSLTQHSSTTALGWYQFCPPDLAFASGGSVAIHLYGAPNMAPVPVVIDISTQPATSVLLPVTVSSGVVSVSSATIPFGVSSVTDKAGYGVSSVTDKAGYGVSSLSIPVGVSSIATPVSVSSVTAPVGVSTVTDKAGYGVSSISIPVGVSSIATPVSASSVTARVGVSTLTAPALANFFDTGAAFFSTAVVSSVVYEIATNVVATASGNVGVSSISILVGVSTVTDKAGYGVSSNSDKGNYGVSTVTDKAGYSVSSAAAAVTAAIADRLLGRNVSSGGDGVRTVSEALYVLRNKVDATLGIVYKTDDTASSWSFQASTMAGNPIVVIDPA